MRQLEDSETGTINNTEKGPGVAVYWKTDRTARADIIVGVILDGYIRSQNINDIKPDTRMDFYVPPKVSCQYREIQFDPDEDTSISIRVSCRPCIYHE